jgi:ABC-type nitrate/sulfonate/bicarbonate transport system substrate-binding protein
VGRILRFGCDILGRAPEKALALRGRDIEAAPDVARTLTRAIAKAARNMEESRGRQEIAAMLARPNRVSVNARLIQRTLVGELVIAANETRANLNDLILGQGGAAARRGACAMA